MTEPVTNSQSESTEADVSEQSSEDFGGFANSLMPGLMTDDESGAPATVEAKEKKEDTEAAPEKEKSNDPEPSLKELKKLYHNKLSKVDVREKKLAEQRSKFKDQVAIAAAAERSLNADLTILTRGDGAQVLEALSRLTKRDAATIYEQMGMALLGKKQDPAKAQIEALENKIKELEEGTKKKESEFERSAKIASVKAEIRANVNDDAWPLIMAEAKDNPKAIEQIETIYSDMSSNAGEWLDTADVFDRIERALRKQSKTAKPDSLGRSQESLKEPEKAQRPPTSIPTSNASVGTAMREIDDDERMKDVVNNFPDLWAQFGMT